MRRVFLFSFLVGFALSIGGAALFPLPVNERFPSSIEVLTNGGRQEDFVIRLPQDRLSLPGNPALVDSAADNSVFVLSNQRSAISAELFRLRDIDDNIVGIAARMTGRGSDGESATRSDWVLMLPSRGSLLLSQRDSVNLMPQLTDDGWKLPAQLEDFWTASRRYRITAGPAADGRGRILRGTEEFARLSGSYSETWELDELDADGRADGRILLSTITEARL